MEFGAATTTKNSVPANARSSQRASGPTLLDDSPLVFTVLESLAGGSFRLAPKPNYFRFEQPFINVV
jgi:hypothetical protein